MTREQALNALDPDVREVVDEALSTGEARLVQEDGEWLYDDPLFGPPVPLSTLTYDLELGLTVRPT